MDVSHCVLSSTEIHILEGGLGWIKEAQETFAAKLFRRLIRDNPEISPILQEMGHQSFSLQLVRTLDSIIGDLCSYGRIRTSLRDTWSVVYPSIPTTPLDPGQFTRIGETFLDLLSEIAEDAWSPAVETAWTKGIIEVRIHLFGQHSKLCSFLTMLSPFHFNKRRNHLMNSTFGFILGTVVVLAGGLASMSVWGHLRLAELKQPKHLSFKKVWCF